MGFGSRTQGALAHDRLVHAATFFAPRDGAVDWHYDQPISAAAAPNYMNELVRNRERYDEIAPDETFLDSSNLPHLDAAHLEGNVGRPMPRGALIGVALVFFLAAIVFTGRTFNLQVLRGEAYADISRSNRLDRSILFATRGVIYDRTGKELAWNTEAAGHDATSTPYALREYIDTPGFAHVLGFIRYPKRDASGVWWRESYAAVSGVELAYDDLLKGINGSHMIETDARGEIVREHIVALPQDGQSLTLSIDADVQAKLFDLLSTHAQKNGFQGGASVIMNVRTGEVLALVSFPEFDNQAFAEGDGEAMRAANEDERSPLLDRAVGGVYTPGSIVKPIFATAALSEHIISPEKKILSTGQIEVPNPYDPDHPSIFRDWRANGWVDLRDAIALSSDVYFYAIGGGFEDQAGLGIAKLDEWARKFGLGEPTGIILAGEASGVIPTPEWKEAVFEGDPWRVGDTYNTSIGQYGFQLTPLQAARYTAAIANGGTLYKPHLVHGEAPEGDSIGVSDADLEIVREGMRKAVHSDIEFRTARALDMPQISIAGKTGTAQVGVHNESMNSWSIGFWPSDDPTWAYATVLERAPAGTPSGAAPAMLPFFQWLAAEKPEYAE